MKRSVLLLVDGSNLLFQMFFGMPAKIFGNNGKPIQGTLGFVGALLKIIRMVNPTHVLVMFDGQGGSDRLNLLEGYKANRVDYSEVPDSDNPYSQLTDIYRALDCMCICHSESIGCEVDDVLASFSSAYTKNVDVVISSFDSDFFQLLDEKTKILRYRGKNTVLCDKQYLFDKLGIRPDQYVFFKALTGDTADNIKGVPGVGPKTASMLVNSFCNAEDLITNMESIKRQSVKKAISLNADRIRLNMQLIRLNMNVSLPFAFEDLAFTDKGYSTMQVLRMCDLR